MTGQIKFFQDGEPAGFCSLCGQLIPEDHVPLMLFKDKGAGGVARFCEPCGDRAIKEGIIKLGPPTPHGNLTATIPGEEQQGFAA